MPQRLFLQINKPINKVLLMLIEIEQQKIKLY